MTTLTRHDSIAIRAAFADDALALRRLAQLDSSPVPAGPLLVAEVDGAIRAALSLQDGAAIADPFHPSDQLVILLEVHAAQLDESHGPTGARRAALRAVTAISRALVARERPSQSVPPARYAPVRRNLPVGVRPLLRAH